MTNSSETVKTQLQRQSAEKIIIITIIIIKLSFITRLNKTNLARMRVTTYKECRNNVKVLKQRNS